MALALSSWEYFKNIIYKTFHICGQSNCWHNADWQVCLFTVVPQDFQDKALPREEAEAEQADPAVDQDENRQQDQVS